MLAIPEGEIIVWGDGLGFGLEVIDGWFQILEVVDRFRVHDDEVSFHCVVMLCPARGGWTG